jgi:hypothetical protein
MSRSSVMVPYNAFEQAHFNPILTYKNVKDTLHNTEWIFKHIIPRFGAEFDIDFIEKIIPRLNKEELRLLTSHINSNILFGDKYMVREWWSWLDPYIISERISYFKPPYEIIYDYVSIIKNLPFSKEANDAPAYEPDDDFVANYFK